VRLFDKEITFFFLTGCLRSDRRATRCHADRSAIGNRLIRLSGCLRSHGLSLAPAQAISTTAVYPDASQLWAIPFSQVPARAVLWFSFPCQQNVAVHTNLHVDKLLCAITSSVPSPSGRPLSELLPLTLKRTLTICWLRSRSS
jgi:hypothetical protein